MRCLFVIFADAAEESSDNEDEDDEENYGADNQIPGGEKADFYGVGGKPPFAFVAGAVNGFDSPVVGTWSQFDSEIRLGQAGLSHARLQWEEVQVVAHLQDVGDAAGVRDLCPGEGNKLWAKPAVFFLDRRGWVWRWWRFAFQ